MIDAWHFCADTLRDGRPIPPDGETLVHDGPVIPCEQGLHASERAIDALRYAPGPIICRVRLGGTIVPHGDPVDKLCASERTILWRVDGTDLLRRFARSEALAVADLWDAPEVVRRYLETGDADLRAAAWDAAMDAALPCAWDAARAAMAAARAAAWDAARGAARAAAWAAAWAAALPCAWDAARAVRDAAWAAAWGAQNDRLTALIEAEATALRGEA